MISYSDIDIAKIAVHILGIKDSDKEFGISLKEILEESFPFIINIDFVSEIEKIPRKETLELIGYREIFYDDKTDKVRINLSVPDATFAKELIGVTISDPRLKIMGNNNFKLDDLPLMINGYIARDTPKLQWNGTMDFSILNDREDIEIIKYYEYSTSEDFLNGGESFIIPVSKDILFALLIPDENVYDEVIETSLADLRKRIFDKGEIDDNECILTEVATLVTKIIKIYMVPMFIANFMVVDFIYRRINL